LSSLVSRFSFSDGVITTAPHPDPSDEMALGAGWVDLQVNGAWGNDFTSDPSSIWEVGARLPETGVTAFLPTIISAPYEVADTAIEVLHSGPPAGYRGAQPIGLHIEGPWISPEWSGAHNPEHLRGPDIEVARRWAVSGVVKMVTIAPELEDAPVVASLLASSGVVVSAGHSDADFTTATQALQGSWTSVTHLFNQMTPFHHRAPGMVGAALLSNRACGVIVDGVHADPAAVELAWRHLGPDRMCLVTDSIAATGLGEGTYLLGDVEVAVGGDGPRTSTGDLAGSTLTMDRALANLVRWTGSTLEQALDSASLVPARMIGATDRGRLAPGFRGDIVALDHDLHLVETIIGGEVVYRSKKG
jgi:N-acetylglucosamine-6-phosphate deacetylase